MNPIGSRLTGANSDKDREDQYAKVRDEAISDWDNLHPAQSFVTHPEEMLWRPICMRFPITTSPLQQLIDFPSCLVSGMESANMAAMFSEIYPPKMPRPGTKTNAWDFVEKLTDWADSCRQRRETYEENYADAASIEEKKAARRAHIKKLLKRMKKEEASGK